MRNDADGYRLFSIGHSHHEVEFFLDLLAEAGVEAIADVRSSPYSRRLPQYNRPDLEHVLKSSGIVYVFMGDQLGGRPEGAALYDDEGRVDYWKVRETDLFRRGLDRLEAARQKFRTALLCAEEDPLDCHRGLMIAPALAGRGVLTAHLRGDGNIETMREMEDRLLEETRLSGLFTQDEEGRRAALEDAYRAMARRKAYRLRPGSEEE
jgi:uncharacterized protein (DUF488 family)